MGKAENRREKAQLISTHWVMSGCNAVLAVGSERTSNVGGLNTYYYERIQKPFLILRVLHTAPCLTWGIMLKRN